VRDGMLRRAWFKAAGAMASRPLEGAHSLARAFSTKVDVTGVSVKVCYPIYVQSQLLASGRPDAAARGKCRARDLVLLAALLLLLALAPCALCCVLVCLIHPRRGRLSRVIGNTRTGYRRSALFHS
jgi:hypothetical protein